LTDCCSNKLPRDSRAYDEVVKLARVRDVPLVTIHLTCDERTNLERATSLARRETVGSTKLTDVEILKATRREYSILSREACRIAGGTIYHELDVSELSQDAAARAIVGIVGAR
jgi:hypothetical protein